MNTLLGKDRTTDFPVRPWRIRRTRKSFVPLNQQPGKLRVVNNLRQAPLDVVKNRNPNHRTLEQRGFSFWYSAPAVLMLDQSVSSANDSRNAQHQN